MVTPVAYLPSLLRLVLIIVGAVVVAKAAHVMVNRIFKSRGDEHTAGRLATINHVLVMVLQGLVWGVAALLILSELGVNIAPILASVGVLGLALSFGAQTLVRDVIAGLFLVVEDQARVGEEVKINEARGTISTLKLRSMVLKDQDGTLHFIPYGEIKSLANYSRKL